MQIHRKAHTELLKTIVTLVAVVCDPSRRTVHQIILRALYYVFIKVYIFIFDIHVTESVEIYLDYILCMCISLLPINKAV